MTLYTYADLLKFVGSHFAGSRRTGSAEWYNSTAATAASWWQTCCYHWHTLISICLQQICHLHNTQIDTKGDFTFWLSLSLSSNSVHSSLSLLLSQS